MNEDGGWGEWKQLVLHQLEKGSKESEAQRKELTWIRMEIAKLKLQASIWGALAGAIPAAIAVIWALMRGR